MSININKKEIEYSKFNKLHIEFSGDDINNVILNTLRRIIIEHIPTYSYNDIKFMKNTSIFNNDSLKIYINNLPVSNINNDTVKYYNDIINNTLNQDDVNNISMFVDVKNTTNDIMNVTTDDAIFYDKDKKIKNIYRKPNILLKLKKNDEIKLSAKTNLNIGLNNIKYSPVSICVFEKINDKKFILKLESNKQIDEYNLIKKACEIIIIKLNNLINQLKDKEINDKLQGEINLKNEDHTLGNLLSFYLQSNTNIIYAGYMMDHLLIQNVTIKFKTDGVKDIIEILFDVIKKIIGIFNYILELI